DHYINYCQAHVLHLIAEAEDLATRGHPQRHPGIGISLTATLDVMKHVEAFWRHEVEWAQHLRQEELTRRQEGSSGQEQMDHTFLAGRREQNNNQNQNPSPNRNRQ
ncbi:MAG: hypothetical protein ACRDHW_14185, partial [Ktedonobacteraceae bacterium]